MPDGAYIELLSFTHPESHYPPSSPSHESRCRQPWANKACGWVAYSFLGAPSSRPPLSALLNKRLRDEGSSTQYEAEVAGGRRRTSDGIEVRWEITQPARWSEKLGGTRLPFFCGDLTPRELRVRAISAQIASYIYLLSLRLCDRYQHDRDQTLNIQMTRRASPISACWPRLVYSQESLTS
jgi:Glyoxalase-like domain